MHRDIRHISFSRSKDSVFARWWWSIDRWLLAAIMLLIGVGFLLQFSATPAIASRLHLPSYYFVIRQTIMIIPSITLIAAMSMFDERWIRRLALLLFIASFILVLLVPLFGFGAKGAVRWINIFGIRIQPSEFLKPSFAVLSAWLMAFGVEQEDRRWQLAAFFLCTIISMILVFQPDIGMAATFIAIWGVQFFLNGAKIAHISGLVAAGLASLPALYYGFPHFRSRIDRFISPAGRDTFQVDTAAAAIRRGAWFGRGPGEGRIKEIVPDAHTDFIMAVTAEEFGMLVCLGIILLIAFISLKTMMRLTDLTDRFCLLAAGGIIAQFTFQSFVNIASTIGMIPSKGMTLPFISYGGSSLLSTSIAVGFLLSLTRVNKQRS